LDDATRAKLETDRNDAVEFERTCAAWKPHYATAIEYPAARIFVALKSGLLRARGRLLPGVDVDAALANLSAEGRDVYDLPIADIAPDFWSLKGIDFESSAARNHRDHYCHVYCDTHEVLAGFPGDKREPVYGVEKIGECFVITDAAEKRIPTAQVHRQRGRPPYHWEAFHLEIAELIRRGDLPAKKEAAIQYFQDWLARALGIKPSRAAIGEKLKPYYDRFVRMADKKS
jgi:hypothetical protein